MYVRIFYILCIDQKREKSSLERFTDFRELPTRLASLLVSL